MAELTLVIGNRNYSSWSLRGWLALEATGADAFFAPIVSRFRTFGVEVGGVAARYMDAVWSLPAMLDWVSKANAEEWTVDRYNR